MLTENSLASLSSRRCGALARLICSLIAIALANATPYEATTFDEFITRFGKRYSSNAERENRQQIFEANVKKIQQMNARHKATFAINEYADMTAEEFQTSKLMSNEEITQQLERRSANRIPNVSAFSSGSYTLPSQQNWYMNATTRIRDQGLCGSCWAVACVSQIESDWFLSGKSGWDSPRELSLQQLVSCDSKGAFGCAGTYAGGGSGFEFVMSNGGLASENDYPYVSGKTGKSGECRTDVKIAGGKIRNWTYAIKPCDLPWDDCNDQDEDTLIQYIATRGPLSICVNAHNWQFYKSGVMTGAACGGHDHGSLDHCVQLVGYSGYSSSSTNSGYWIVRNSWVYKDGKPWGEDGFIFLEMGNNTCGVADVPSYSIV